ncbi:hypothetical protein [Belliella aquatica]|uniref:Phytase-like domain-containing protein n=1 Tax=Belliella aquatica TaxID=1323734 RepID=A0ABQ1M176_9BACT|nr:hypothetical protein [Belliella aquatica]MCH7407637.1 hypothetical protein [Belliella aquatica]GGC32573.1 hypothetical protein GCM10010993_09390 [Belliella aquatica]
MNKYSFKNILAAGILIGGVIFQSGCSKEKDQEQVNIDATSFEFDIIDSVMIDYLGSVSWSDISKDGKHILAYNNQNMDVLLFSTDGEVVGTFNKSGDQPDAIGGSPLSRPQFVKKNEWAITGKNGVFAFDFNGDLTRTAKPGFPVTLSLTISNANILHFLDEDRALVHFLGRDGKGTFYVNPEAKQLEKISLKDGNFVEVMPLPENSKYKNSEKIHNVLTVTPAIDIHDGKLYVAFKNEPKLWIYDLNKLDQPEKQINIQFDKFIEKEGIAPDAVDNDNVGINVKDFTFGSIDKLFVYEDMIIIQYSKGITDAEYKEVSENVDNPMDIFSKIFEKNKWHFAILNSEGQIKPITLPERVGNIEFIDQEGNLWLSYDREEELDYELIFKAKLKAIQ